MRFGERAGTRVGERPEDRPEHRQRDEGCDRPDGDTPDRIDEVPASRAGPLQPDPPALQTTARLPDDPRRSARRLPGLDERVAGRNPDRLAGTQEVVVRVAASRQPDLTGLDAKRAALGPEMRGTFVKMP